MSVVTEAIKAARLENRSLLVACSGGVDSMVLLRALVETGLKPAVLHVNYGLRGSDSDADEQFVSTTAVRVGLECLIHRCPVDLLKAKGVNLQKAARDFRRELFLEWTGRSQSHVVVLAHHLDDQLETFFLQYFRGSGLFGLGGMHSESRQIVRPFLDLPKEALLAFARENTVEWREDASNATGNYLRNVLRNKLLPALKETQPGLAESARIIMKALRNLQQETLDSVLSSAGSGEKGRLLSVSEWESFSAEQKLAFTKSVAWPPWTVDRLDQLAQQPFQNRFAVGEEVIIKLRSHFVRLTSGLPQQSWEFKREEVEVLPSEFDKSTLYLDADEVKGELCLRTCAAGDRIRSLGMKGSQLVSDVLKDAGIPLHVRQEIPILTDNRDILWIPGIKIARTAIASRDTKRILKITIIPAASRPDEYLSKF